MLPQRWQPTRLHGPWDCPGKNAGVGCLLLLQYMKVKSEREVAQSCQTLLDPMDCSLPGSSVHGIFQARVLEWGTIAFSVPHSMRPAKPVSHSYRACMLQLLKPASLEPVLYNKKGTTMRNPHTLMKSSPCLPQLEKTCMQQQRPSAAKNKIKKFMPGL